MVLFNDSCMINCPTDYIKAAGGATCEIKPYLLDGSIVYFPYLGSAFLIMVICITSYFISEKKAMILSNAVALISLLEMASVATLFYEAYVRNYILIEYGAGSIMIAMSFINIIHFIAYCAWV